MWPGGRALVVLTMVIGLLAVAAKGASADEGTASWYGQDFQGKKMANGQVFDMYDPTTTATNLFPFGAWLKVTNIANGRTTVVQVRDRGPFDHALDLSYAAFASLADPNKGVIRVRHEAVPGPGGESNKQSSSGTVMMAPAATPTLGWYVVWPGDTLSEIAGQFGTSTQLLIKMNGLARPDSLVVGQFVKVRHIVQEGETLSGLAASYDLSVDQLVALNDIANPNVLRVGDALRLNEAPRKSSRGTGVYATTGMHVVQSGETLGEIALRYGVSEKDLAELNDLSNPDRIVIGQTLRLPSTQATAPTTASHQSSKEYTVQSGDTLLGIALSYRTTLKDIVSLNNLRDEDYLLPGQVLRLP